MTWLAPGYLLAGALAAIAVVALHLLAWRRPPVAPLPTARFVPDAPARARARSTRPADPWLLALRVLALLLASAALARPVRVAPRVPLARVMVVDRSGSTGDEAAVERTMREAGRADAVVALDSGARATILGDSIAALLPGMRIGRLSPALVLARDAARRLAHVADSVELVLVSPLLREEIDAATATLAGAWGGRIRVVRVAAARRDTMPLRAVQVDAAADDAVEAGLDAGGIQAGAARLVRRAATAADSAWVVAAPGRLLVTWPVAVAPPDAPTAALAWGDDAVVAPMAVDAGAAPAGDAIVRWADGRVAATERAVGAGCMREARVALPRAGDVTLSTGFVRLLARLVAPCGGPRDLTAVDPASIGFRTSGPALALARPVPRDPWQVARWLLGAAIALLLAEPLLRRGAVNSEAPRRERTSDGAARAEAA